MLKAFGVPTRARTTLMSFSYALAGTFYLIAAALVSGATILFFRETAFERLR